MRIRPSPAVLLTAAATLTVLALAALPGRWGVAYGQTAGLPPTTTEEAGGVTVDVTNRVSITASTEVTVSVATSSDEGTVDVQLPAGALPSGTSVEVAAVENLAELVQQAPPAAAANVDLVLGFTIAATDDQGAAVTEDFAAPVTVEFTVPQQTVPVDADAQDIVVAFWNGVTWVILSTTATVNPDGSVTLAAETDHFTLFSVLVLRPTVFQLPPAAGLSQAVSGTNDPARLAAVQGRDVEALFILVAGDWKTFIPNGPTFVNTLTSSNLTPDSPVTIRFRAPAGAAPPPPASPAPPPPASSPTPAPTPVTAVTVQPGDTIITIAERHGVDWQALAALNDIAGPDYLIQPGQVLQLPEPGNVAVVLEGDTLIDIGARVGVDWQEIATLNGIEGPDYLLTPGQILKLP